MLIGLLTIPYLIKNLGVELFGVLTLIWAMIGYFSLFDFGLGRALTQSIAEKRALNEFVQLEKTARIGLYIIGAAGLLGLFIFAFGAKSLGYKLLNVSPALEEHTYHSLLIAAFGIPLAALTAGLKGILEAFEKFKIVNQLKLVLGLANFILPAAVIYFVGPSIEWIVFSIVFARLVILVFHAITTQAIVRIFGIVTLYDIRSAKSLFKFGAWMTVSNLVSPLMVISDRFLISYYLGAATVALYTVPAEFLTRLLIIPAAYTAALFPRFAQLRAVSLVDYRNIYIKSLKYTSFLMIGIFCIVSIIAHPGLSLWINADFAEKTSNVAIILALGVMFNGIAQVPHCSIQASGGAKVTAQIHLVEFVIYIPMLLLFMKYFGLIGAAIAWTARAFIDLVVLLVFASKTCGRGV